MFNRRFLVVGATGHVGSQAAVRLANMGHDVTALVRREGSVIRDPYQGKITYVTGDLADEASLRKAVAGIPAYRATQRRNSRGARRSEVLRLRWSKGGTNASEGHPIGSCRVQTPASWRYFKRPLILFRPATVQDAATISARAEQCLESTHGAAAVCICWPWPPSCLCLIAPQLKPRREYGTPFQHSSLPRTAALPTARP